MKEKIRHVWQKASRLGLKEHEGVQDHREVVLLNKLLTLFPLILLVYIPVEIFFNGVEVVYLVFILIALMLFPLFLNGKRYFRLAAFVVFITGLGFVFTAGLLVGRDVGNYVAFIPIVLFGVVIFKTKLERFLAFLLVLLLYVSQYYLFDSITPSFIISSDSKTTFPIIFFTLSLLLNYLLGIHFLGINHEFEKIITRQKDSIETKNKELLDSITYAKRIQSAILPQSKLVKDYLQESFILYKPKDIVAGDFYWFEVIDDTIYFAAADCTGHGVPGAMVSVVCHNALNRSVKEYNLKTPGEILDKTREIVIAEFEKSDEDVKDGMDISLAALRFSTVEASSKLSFSDLTWAGAHNPLWIIRNGALIEFKANKQPIGRFSHAKKFTTHQIDLHSGDLIYIFTDGYQDQFGGPDSERGGKKFKASRMRELLLSLDQKPMDEMRLEIDEAFENWKGDLEQVDDVCVIGVRV